MSVVAWIMAVFAVLGALDRIFGNKLGLGKEFEKGMQLLGPMALSMVGMIVLAPLIAAAMTPLMRVMTGTLDAAALPALLFANDMGGASLSTAVANDPLLGKFHALVVSSMMGCTFSFTIPYALGVVPKDKHKSMFLGILCGIVTIPVGCFIGGLILQVPVWALFVNILPMIALAGVIVFGLLKFPDACVKIFSVLGAAIKILVTLGLAAGIFEFLTGVDIPYTDDLTNGMDIVVNASCVMAGAFPLLHILSKLLDKPMAALGKKLGIDGVSTIGFVASLATNVTTFGMMEKMNERGAIYNSAFAVSGGFTLAGHLAFTLAFSADCLPAVIVGKLVAAISALAVAYLLFGKEKKERA